MRTKMPTAPPPTISFEYMYLPERIYDKNRLVVAIWETKLIISSIRET